MNTPASPAISIIIPAYNKEEYIDECLYSATHQTFSNIEIIIVDDGSSDKTLEKIRSVAHADSRIHVLSHTVNEGRHKARKTGVSHASGDYIIFLDADDSLELTACEGLYNFVKTRPDADIVRYGMNVYYDDSADNQLAFQLSALLNVTRGDLRNSEILQATFNPPNDLWVPWNVITSFIRTSIAQKAFSELLDTRLNKIEDGYEYLAICSLSQHLYSFVEFRALKYHFGRGISGKSTIPLSNFLRDQQSAYDVDQAVRTYANQYQSRGLNVAAQNFHLRTLRIIGDDFFDRLSVEDWDNALAAMQQTWGNDDTYIALHAHIYKVIYDELESTSDTVSDKYLRYAQLFRNCAKDLTIDDNNINLVTLYAIDAIQKIEERQSTLEKQNKKSLPLFWKNKNV